MANSIMKPLQHLANNILEGLTSEDLALYFNICSDHVRGKVTLQGIKDVIEADGKDKSKLMEVYEHDWSIYKSTI